MKTIKKILVANRGEIALRIMSTVQAMGMESVAVFSDADKDSSFVIQANEAIALGGNAASETYLNQDKIIAAAKLTGADAIHPGYGFLSENAVFAKRCEDEGVIFLGPSPNVISLLGSKSRAKEIAREAGVPVVPGYEGEDQAFERFKYEAEEIGYPVLLKASAGGGGKGMRIVQKQKDLKASLEAATREAEKAFGDGRILMEKYFENAKHIEVQIVGDEHGNVLHLGERECSMQRRYQKLIEESPSPSIEEDTRNAMCEAAVNLAKAVSYTSLGTVEFLLDEEDNYYFLEVNTRLQVEHPVTEMRSRLDLVSLQIQVAQGHQLPPEIAQMMQPLHAIECRICAEDPENNFLPSTGELLVLRIPLGGMLNRADNGFKEGDVIDVHYDSLLAKLIVVGGDREDARQRMIATLNGASFLGLTTNKDFLEALLQHEDFIEGTYDVKLIEREFVSYKKDLSTTENDELVLAAMLYDWNERIKSANWDNSLNGWRNIFYASQYFEAEIKGKQFRLSYRHLQNNRFDVQISEISKADESSSYAVELMYVEGEKLAVVINQHRKTFILAKKENNYFIQHPTAGTVKLTELPRFSAPDAMAASGAYRAPMPGEIIKVLVKVGENVSSGKPLVIISSMKMETTIEAHSDGVVEEIFVEEKAFVGPDAVLLRMKDNSPET